MYLILLLSILFGELLSCTDICGKYLPFYRAILQQIRRSGFNLYLPTYSIEHAVSMDACTVFSLDLPSLYVTEVQKLDHYFNDCVHGSLVCVYVALLWIQDLSSTNPLLNDL